MIGSALLLTGIGIIVGSLGTLIGAGGGFVLVPILLFMYPSLKPESVTAVSMAIVACNALSGTFAYARARRIDIRAGIQFSICTIPGSILGVLVVRYIAKGLFMILFGGFLILLAGYLFFRKKIPDEPALADAGDRKTAATWIGRQVHHHLQDKSGEIYDYVYTPWLGWLISLAVGFISPILGIGGGIIHVPALVSWLRFPVHVATATSHFILAIMSTVSVIAHIAQGNYQDPHIRHLVLYLGIGVIGGAQLGAFFSHRVTGRLITRALAVSLGLVGLRMLLT